MEEAITYAKKFLEDMLSFFGANIDVYATRDDEVIQLSVPSTYLNGFLIGQRGDTLRSIQHLVSAALRTQGFEHTRVNVDVADYKKHRHDRLAEEAKEWIDQVRSSKEPMHLKPMNPADRRVVHKAVADYGGVTSESEGTGRDRHIVLKAVETTEEPAAE
jgi:spoIIIJ-associated protein